MNSSRQTIGKWYGCCSVEYAPGQSLLGASAAGLVLAACTRPTSGGELGAILDRLSTNMLRESPESATGLAVSEEQAGSRYIDRLSNASRGDGAPALAAFTGRWAGHWDGLCRISSSCGISFQANQRPVHLWYVTEVPTARPFFDAHPDSPLEAFEAEAHRYPVFRVAGEHYASRTHP